MKQPIHTRRQQDINEKARAFAAAEFAVPGMPNCTMCRWCEPGETCRKCGVPRKAEMPK